MSVSSSFFSRVKEAIQSLLALNITEAERVRYAGFDFLEGGVSTRRPTQVAVVIALLFHVALFLMVFPSLTRNIFKPDQQVLILRNLAPAGGTPPRPAVRQVAPKEQPIVIPIPDPTPDDPEPLRRTETLEVQPVVDEMSADLSLGDINAPVNGRGGTGTGDSYTGPGAGSEAPGPGLRNMGDAGVVDPVLLVKTTPTYTNEAIKAKVQGVVVLQAVIRKNGRVDQPSVLRGLGYGLEQQAIKEIVTNWRFRPATYEGAPVDLLATIEVTFSLR
jgi:protein TonB